MRKALIAALAVVATPSSGARAPASAAYDLFIAGIPIGEAELRIEAADGRYRVEGAADFGFLFWGGEGVAVAEGAAGPDSLKPALYQLRYQGVSRPGAVEIAFENGRAVRWAREPEIPEEYREGRVPPGPEHLSGVLDPLSALVVPAAATASAESVCRRVLPVFSGYTRFDLSLEGAEALDGEAVACAVRYRPVAGHRADSRSVRRLSEPGAVALRLAPLADGFWGPDRVALETRFGLFELERRR
jgi:hypothetical protein